MLCNLLQKHKKRLQRQLRIIIPPCLQRDATTWWRSHRLFDLLIPAPELLGLVDPLPLVFWESLQVQLQTTRTRVSAKRTGEGLQVCCRKRSSHLPAHAPKAAAPQPAVDARLPDPGQVITVEEEVVPFFPAGGEGGWQSTGGLMSVSTQTGHGAPSKNVSPGDKPVQRAEAPPTRQNANL